MTYAKIHTTGRYLPTKVVSNCDLPSTLNTSHEWIVERTGIERRHIAQAHETTSYMASQAAINCLEKSGLEVDDIDMILVATCTPDHFFPSMACYVQKALGCSRYIPSMDISAACSGFIYALDVANQYILSGTARNIMVVGSESMSRAVDWTDRSSCILFGDGAAAVIISASDQPGIIGSQLHASHDNDGLLSYPNNTGIESSAFISMKGNEVFKLAVNHMGNIVDQILEKYCLKKSDINWLLPHQANFRIIKAIAKKLELPMSQVILTIADQGNTSAASIPLAFDYAIENNLIKRGEIILMESFGGGLTWGAMLLQY